MGTGISSEGSFLAGVIVSVAVILVLMVLHSSKVDKTKIEKGIPFEYKDKIYRCNALNIK